jgi:hypothetical protein
MLSGWPRSRFEIWVFRPEPNMSHLLLALPGARHAVLITEHCSGLQRPSLVQLRFLEDEESLMAAGETAGPSTSLRYGRDDNSVETGIDATEQ